MPLYRPQNISQSLLVWLAQFENKIGRKARRFLMRAYGPRALAAFEARLPSIGPNDICLDLGANVGDFTRLLAKTGAQVHAYEPDPLAFGLLQQNVGSLPNVTLHQAAVSVTSGTVRLRRSRKFAKRPVALTTMSSIVLKNPAKFADDGIDVEMRAFRDVVQSFGRRIALVKMDIEGAEFDILRQIFATPADFDIDAIYCETHERESYPEFREIDRMRAQSETMAHPYVNLYWP